MSEEIISKQSKPKINYLLIVTFIIAIVGLFLPQNRNVSSSLTGIESTLNKIQDTKVIRIGYEGYPPYTIKDPKTGKLSGYSVDMAEYIAREAGWEIAWVQSSANTKIPDLELGRFDIMVEPIYRTIPRATRVAFTRPYAYFGYAVGIVRKGEKRFQQFKDLNHPEVSIALRLGYASQTYAEENLPLAEKHAMNVSDISEVFLDVISGNSDIALADLEQVKRFAEEHSGQVEAIFINNPPASVPAGFMLRRGDFAFYNFLNAAIDYLEANRILDQLDEEYGVSAVREKKLWISKENKLDK